MATHTDDRALQLIFMPNVVENSSVSNTKFISACFAGAAAGIVGLENWAGFVLFIVSTLFTTTIIYGVDCKGRPEKYFQGGLMELMNPGQDNAFTFVLVWTLFYGIVHVVLTISPSVRLRHIYYCIQYYEGFTNI